MTAPIPMETIRTTIQKHNQAYRRRLTITSSWLLFAGTISLITAGVLITATQVPLWVALPAVVAVFEGARGLLQARHAKNHP